MINAGPSVLLLMPPADRGRDHTRSSGTFAAILASRAPDDPHATLIEIAQSARCRGRVRAGGCCRAARRTSAHPRRLRSPKGRADRGRFSLVTQRGPVRGPLAGGHPTNRATHRRNLNRGRAGIGPRQQNRVLTLTRPARVRAESFRRDNVGHFPPKKSARLRALPVRTRVTKLPLSTTSPGDIMTIHPVTAHPRRTHCGLKPNDTTTSRCWSATASARRGRLHHQSVKAAPCSTTRRSSPDPTRPSAP